MAASINTPSELDSLIQKATSESIPNGEIDLSISLEVSDVIRSRRVSPKDSMRCLKRRIVSTRSNPNASLAAWRLTEVCLKNGGVPFIKEVCSREFMDSLEHAILQESSNDELEALCKSMLQDLYMAFRNDSQLNYVAKVHQRLVNRGVTFPSNSSHSELAATMFDSKTPADWIDSDCCMICSTKFSLLNRKHHCRSCGGIFCQEHSSHNIQLPDLGIYEPVRVCDDCFEEYDAKRQPSKKHSKKKKKRSKKDSTIDEEDEDLRKAIELSLRESQAQDTFVPVIAPPEESSKKAPENEEEDEDLKAAIAASLRESEELKRRQEQKSQQLQSQGQRAAANISRTPDLIIPPSNELTASEEDDIHLFANLVERMKSEPPSAVLEDTQLQQLYRKVMGTVPKLNLALNESSHKYNALVDMNGKISDIMNIYDALLEKQLQSINLNQHYFTPQLPSDPYSYYNIGQQTSSPVFSNVPQQQVYEQQTYQSPVVASRPQIAQHVSAISAQSQAHSAPHANEPLPQPPISHAQQLQDVITNPSERPKATKTFSRPYPDETNEEQLTVDQLTSVPSEPPYPTDDEEKEENKNATVKENEEKEEEKPSQNGSKGNDITSFDFPTVPVQQPPHKENAMVDSEEAKEVEEPEQLLIEL